MWKAFAIVLLIVTAYANAAYAGGGGAEPMPQTNYTDLPSYHPNLPSYHPIPWDRHSKHMFCCRHLSTTHRG
jgi:hypothetical protein